MDKSFALENAVHFLREHWTEPYEGYCSGRAQLKNVLRTKNDLQGRALPGLQEGMVRKS